MEFFYQKKSREKKSATDLTRVLNRRLSESFDNRLPQANSMSTHAFASAVIDAPVNQVWALLRDFTFSRVFSTVESVNMEDGATGTTVGAVRVVHFKNGATSRQRLTGLSDVHRTLSYEGKSIILL